MYSNKIVLVAAKIDSEPAIGWVFFQDILEAGIVDVRVEGRVFKLHTKHLQMIPTYKREEYLKLLGYDNDDGD